jgi:threonyl-tRNA synthetase
VVEVAQGASTADVAAAVGAGLARKAIAGRVTLDSGAGEVYDLNHPLPGDCQLKILTATDEDADSLHVLRHSAAHVMAEAICKLFPDTQLVYGPALEDGFYYDIDLPRSLTPDDFPPIEEEMRRIIMEKRPFRRHDMSREEGMAKLRDEGSRYKIDNAERAAGDTLSFYVTGDNFGQNFEDLCRGPHVPSTEAIKAFKIRQVSRSYYRGDVNDTPLQRVYGTAFFKKSSLDEYLKRMAEAKKRDHRVIGRQLDLFVLSEHVGSGLVLWTAKGAIIRTELQNYLTEEMLKLGYQIVMTPHIGRLDLYRTSGHYPYYEDSQFPPMHFVRDNARALLKLLREARNTNKLPDVEEEREKVRQAGILESEYPWEEQNPLRRFAIARELSMQGIEARTCEEVADYYARGKEAGYLLKPMNCPHHIALYASRLRSYRDLPIRLGEYGTVHRYEQSGEVSGLTRVRGFTQDDAHLFCTNEQLAEELIATVKLTRKVLEALALTDYSVRLGLRDADSEKYVGSDENWAKAEAAIRAAAVESGVEYVEEAGEAAFYGPKIDFVVKDCIGRSWQLGTVQVDYNLPERFDLSYVGPDNQPHRPVMIHRTPFGSLERFVGILIENFAGAFPLWLSPVQVGVASVSEKSGDYARKVYTELTSAGLRAELDTGSEKIGPKKHRFRAAQVNYILVVGEREAAEKTVNVNDRGGRGLGDMTIEAFAAACRREIENKSLDPVVGPGSG